jgi:serine/threonine protein kinase
MLEHPAANRWSLTPSQAEHVDRVCDAFEAAWKAVAPGGERPRIEQYLAETPEPAREVLLQELLDLDAAYRRQLGEQPTLEEYRLRFPDFFRQMTLGIQARPAGDGRPTAGPTGAWPDGPGHTPLQGDPGPVPEALPDWPSVPGYEILGELGRGGMGVVYRAWQTGLKRLVALKMIRDSVLAGPEQRARFRIEAEAAARLRHPNIVHVYEINEHQGRPFFSMEFAEGGSLDRKLAGRPLPPAEAADLVQTLARAVHHAHQRHVIHRDLKPANVLLTGDGRPMITDFGLAKLLDGDGGWTQSGAVMGTANYMAPEQAGGKTRQVGPATDVYALGAILYELVTGQPPFRAENWQATVQQVIHDEPPPPTRLRPDVPPGLEQICLKCLAKDPGQRYARAADLADDLRRFLAGEPLLASALPLSPGADPGRPPAVPGYEVIEPLGPGNSRVRLYKVRDSANGRLACLKTFHGLIDRADLQRYRSTALKVLDGLEHPNLARVYDCGAQGDWSYIVQEFAPGGSLRQRIGRQPQPVHDSARLVEVLARAVQFVHDRGLVHGNLEPANVLLEADGTPRIAEVGLVNQPGGEPPRPADSTIALTMTLRSLRARSLRASRTDLSNFVGNLRYLAPEVIFSDAIGPHSDIYSLGAILYHLLTGRPPFEGDSLHELMMQVFSQPPVPPCQQRTDVPPAVEAICLKCLQKQPRQRYATAEALAEELRHFLAGGMVAAPPVGEGKAPPQPGGLWRRLFQRRKPRP